jgi:hypothetical protein
MGLRDYYHACAIQGSRAPLIIPLNFSDGVIFFSIQTQRPLPPVYRHLAERVDLDPVKKNQITHT